MGRRLKRHDFLLSDGRDEYSDVWGRFSSDNELSIYWGKPSEIDPVITLGEEELRTLTRMLVQRFPLEAMGGV